VYLPIQVVVSNATLLLPRMTRRVFGHLVPDLGLAIGTKMRALLSVHLPKIASAGPIRLSLHLTRIRETTRHPN
jgi:hypothetical protein